MQLMLSLSPEEIAELRRRASSVGADVETFLLHLIRDTEDADDSRPNQLPFEQWKHEFQLWIEQHQSRNSNMDDSRESIYD